MYTLGTEQGFTGGMRAGKRTYAQGCALPHCVYGAKIDRHRITRWYVTVAFGGAGMLPRSHHDRSEHATAPGSGRRLRPGQRAKLEQSFAHRAERGGALVRVLAAPSMHDQVYFWP